MRERIPVLRRGRGGGEERDNGRRVGKGRDPRDPARYNNTAARCDMIRMRCSRRSLGVYAIPGPETSLFLNQTLGFARVNDPRGVAGREWTPAKFCRESFARVMNRERGITELAANIAKLHRTDHRGVEIVYRAPCQRY